MPATNFTWDPVSENILFEFDENVPTIEYSNLPEQFGQLISKRQNGNSSFYSFDGLGSTRNLTDKDAKTTASADYASFGGRVGSMGETVGPFGFKGALGYYVSPSSDSVLVRQRTYDPTNGRWLSQDPLGLVDGPNVYLYALNSPISFEDPSGAVCQKTERRFDLDVECFSLCMKNDNREAMRYCQRWCDLCSNGTRAAIIACANCAGCISMVTTDCMIKCAKLQIFEVVRKQNLKLPYIRKTRTRQKPIGNLQQCCLYGGFKHTGKWRCVGYTGGTVEHCFDIMPYGRRLPKPCPSHVEVPCELFLEKKD